MATEQNFTFQRGEDWIIAFSLNDVDGEDLSLDGAVVRFGVWDTEGTVLIDFETADIGVDSPAQGEGTITVTPDDQAEVQPGAVLYELRVVLGDGRTSTQAFGRIVVGASPFSWPAGSPA